MAASPSERQEMTGAPATVQWRQLEFFGSKLFPNNLSVGGPGRAGGWSAGLLVEVEGSL